MRNNCRALICSAGWSSPRAPGERPCAELCLVSTWCLVSIRTRSHNARLSFVALTTNALPPDDPACARPAPNLWKAWDSLGLTQDGVVLVGWWDSSPVVTVTSVGSQSPSGQVFASAYLRAAGVKEMMTTTVAGSTNSTGGVIAVASWDNKDVQNVQLHIDWDAFGLTVDTAAVTASPIEGFQPGLEINPNSYVFRSSSKIPVRESCTTPPFL